MQSVYWIETFPHGMSKDLIYIQERKNQTYQYNKTIQQLINFDVVIENINEHNPNWK